MRGKDGKKTENDSTRLAVVLVVGAFHGLGYNQLGPPELNYTRIVL